MDKDNILKYWATANFNSGSQQSNSNSNSNSHHNSSYRQNQESDESLQNPDPNSSHEKDDAIKDFERTIQEAKLNLMRSLQAKFSNVTGNSETEILALKKRLHESEIKNSELSQENSKLREEKRRCELSSEMAQVSASILERQLQDVTRKKTELESTIEEKTRENSALQFLLEEKEAQVYDFNQSVLNFTREKSSQNISKGEHFTPFPLQAQKPQEQMEISSRSFLSPVETLNPLHVQTEPRAQFIDISIEDDENVNNNYRSKSNALHSSQNSHISPQSPQQFFSRENVEENDQEENYRKFLCTISSTSRVTPQKLTCEKERKSDSPQIQRRASTSVISSPKEREKANPPKRTGNRFEKSISLQLKRERPILKPSPLATFENGSEEDSDESGEDEPSTKRTRTFSGASASTSASTKSTREEKGQKSSSSSTESVLNVPEIYRINYGFTNNWEMENCSHARDFWYDPNHLTIYKFLIRFYDDQEYQKIKRLHVKQQKNTEEPKIKYEKLIDIERKFDSLKKKSDSGFGFRLFLDVRDFNIFSNKISLINDFGQFVTHFSFGRRLFSFGEISASQLLNFILEHFTNLEYLAINDGMLKKMDQPLKIISEKKLEKLKTVRLTTVGYRTIGYKTATPLIIQLLLHAPAIEKMYGIPLYSLSEIQSYFEKEGNSTSNLNLPPWCQKQGGKISMDFIKEVAVIRNIYDEGKNQCNERSKNFLSDISTLQRLNTSLEVVDVRTYFIRNRETRSHCVEKWSKVLNLIKTHVKSLTIEPCQIKNIPQFKNLQSLHFDMETRHSENNFYCGYFPPGFDLQYNFPQLKIVEIGLNEKSSQFVNGDDKKAEKLFHSHFPPDVFRPHHTFEKVERLNLVNFAPPTCIIKLQALFPWITILQLAFETVEMSNVLPKVYKWWPGLKQLILAVTFSSHVNYNLDSAFTGMHFSKCLILHQQIRNKDLSLEKSVEETISKYKTKSSIWELKDLTLLKMVLHMRETDRDHEIADCLMTPVSGIYGFGSDQMPNLKVVLGFDERMMTADKKSVKKLLEPMKSYLTIDD